MELPDWLDPLFDAAQMREVDRWAIEDRSVPSLDLMERAGTALAEAAGELFERELARGADGPVAVICGRGNNGGDGFVCARVLRARSVPVEVLLLHPPEDARGDAAANLERLGDGITTVAADQVNSALEGASVIVDAILGTGSSGAPREPAAAAIAAITAARTPVVACDIPSGVDASSGRIEGEAVEAEVTVTFHAPKLGHRIHPGRGACGRVVVAPIGIPDHAPVAPAAGELSARILAALSPREAGSTKFSSGRVVLAGGSRGLTGAVAMAALASIRAGAGYATAIVPRSLEPILEVKLTEVMTLGAAEQAAATGFAAEAASDALEAGNGAGAFVLGPGLGRTDGALEFARAVAAAVEAPLVLDADGLFAFAEAPERLAARSAPTILTPHAGELGRLLGVRSADVSASRLESAKEVAATARAIVVLKGEDTIVVDGSSGLVGVNALASPGLATAGTGDVLSGMIAALIARGLEPFEGACAAVLAHSRAGHAAAEKVSAECVIATDVIAAIPEGLEP